MHIAQSVRAVITKQHPLARHIMDRTQLIDQSVVDQTLSLTQFTWHGRRPSKGVDAQGRQQATNLDLLSLVVELARRDASITLPGYQRRLPKQFYANEQHDGSPLRGPIVGLSSHRERLSLGVTINDQSIVRINASALERGATRTYLVADQWGEWHDGWQGLAWQPTPSEAEFCANRQLAHEGGIAFKYYLHPERRKSIYGAPYLLLKLLWQRLEDELVFYRQELVRLRGVDVEAFSANDTLGRQRLATGPSENCLVPTFQVKLQGVSFSGEYTPVSGDSAGYQLAADRIKYVVEQLRPMVQFIMRSDEVAYLQHGLAAEYVPHWIKGTDWQVGSRDGWCELALSSTVQLAHKRERQPVAVAA